ncbi:MAG: membrane protein [Phycisphaerae bacterium]|nr:MAG: membrane protein [Phycisphaerae bacterium]
MNTSTLILAALVNPALFWGGAAAMSAPIIIHLLARRRFQRIRWAAMSFLMDADKQNRKRVRMEELILLALRCLAVLLIGLLISRPFIQPSGMAALLGGSQRTERIFVLDDSFSMGYQANDRTIFDDMKSSVRNLLQRLRDHAPHDTVTLIRSTEPENPIVEGAVLDDRQYELLLARLEAMQPTQRSQSVERCMTNVRKLLDGDDGVLSCVLYVISDFQEVDWLTAHAATGEGGAASGSLAGELADWSNEDRDVRVVLVDVGDDSPQNVAITELQSKQRQVVTGVAAQLEATINNFGTLDADALELQIANDASGVGSMPTDPIPAGRKIAAAISSVIQRAGDASIAVSASPDRLAIDDTRYLALEATDGVRVLVVNGEPSTDSYLDETHLLTTALRPEGDVFSGNQVDVIDESALDGTSLDDYHLIILANLYRVSEPIADDLHRFVFAGGGLAIFLGDQVTDPLAYNSTLYRDGEGLLPASLQAIVRAKEAGVHLAPSDFLHPVVRVFSGQVNPFLDRVNFFQYFATEPATFAPDEQNTDATARAPTTVIARYDDDESTPAIMERTFGRGRVLLFTSTCDLEWNDWARDASYVIGMLEITQHLARAGDANRSTTVGKPLTFALNPSDYEPQATLRLPGYPQQEDEDVVASTDGSKGMQISWAHTAQAGIYSFELRRRDGRSVARRFAVNVDARESDLSPATEDDLRRSLDGLIVEYIEGVAIETDETEGGRKELWPMLLVAAMSLLMIEQVMAWRFGRT